MIRTAQRTLIAIGLCASLALPAAAEKKVSFGVQGWTPGLGNPYAGMITGAIHPFISMFDTLTELDENGLVQPHLALSWTVDSPTTWTFKLRPGVVFANGEPFDATAVKAALEWLKTTDGQRFILASEVRKISKITVVDDLTLVIETSEPDVILTKRLSLLRIVPPKYFAEVGADAFAQAPVGTGPFVLRTWGRDTGRSIWDANPNSWRGRPAIDRYDYVVLPEAARRTQALMLDEIDIAYSLDLGDADYLKEQGYGVVVQEVPTVGGLTLSNIHPNSPLADKRVRLAMNYAINREAITKIILHGAVKPSAQGIAPGVFGYDPTLEPYPYDPDKSRALLAEAGYAKGISLVARVIVVGITNGQALYQMVAQDLRAVGIDVEMQPALGPDWVRMWFSGDWRGADMISHTWGGNTYMDAARPLENVMCTKSGAYFCMPEIDAMIRESNTMFDPAEREAKLQQIIRRLHEEAPMVVLFPQTDVMAYSNKISASFKGRSLDWVALDTTEE
ncbi:MAG: hypothetical protein KDE14_12875 [Rhodobacteraceae bacterium]|nr:hypothetical protein [Paracoccaceae bacterium]